MKCRSHVSLNMIEDQIIVALEMLLDLEEQVVQIRQRLKEAKDQHKSYTDAKNPPREFDLGENVLFKVKPQKSAIKLGKNAKLAPRYVGHFEVLENVNLLAYKIALPLALA